MSDKLTDSRDILDSREVIERIADLEAIADERGADQMDADDAEELAALIAFRDEMSDYCPDWEHGETLIADHYFRDYAQELAEDIGAVPSDLSWPVSCIDWEQAARELRMDYTSAELAGVTYWGR